MTNESGKNKDSDQKKGRCACPFCDAPLEIIGPLCKACGVTITYCQSCGKPLPQGEKECPDCGS